MEENKDLDDFIKKIVKEAGLEKPSVDFTNSVLSKIEVAQQKDNIFVAKPLFSKTTWLLTVIAVTALFGYVIFGSSNAESTWVAAAKLNRLTSFNLSLNIPELGYSTALIYGSITIAFFVWIQVLLLKQRQSKRLVAS
ncbi:hypothetical protein FEE95_15295 [Maribacter algarum]|uniref:Uncharacterized protein n=1 Tax=Maribacter algarum (ex Zhang et al. 2020) TaxID=2578118 RepID=A0A5S3PNK6_9FLAO|nr:hypothetical protein [Maribacter algarum]TMM56006.1 hypothetical protein FEE95_15295 [Maribacter algarum]